MIGNKLSRIRQWTRQSRHILLILIWLAASLFSAPAWAAPSMHASKSTVVASPTTVLANGVATSTITVTIRRSNGQAMRDISVQLVASGGSSIIATASNITNNSGIVTFTVRDSVVESVTYTAIATDPGNPPSVTVTQRPTVNFVRPAPVVVKSFSPAVIGANGTSLLSITLTNTNASAITGATFTDNYPPNLLNSGTVTNTCGGTATAAAGGASMSLSGGTVPGNGSCSVSVVVTSAIAASYPNSTGLVTTSNSQAGSAASATLTVQAISAANSTVNANPTTVLANGVSSSTITVTLRDGANLPVAGKTVTLAKSSGSSVISPASAVTNSSGVAIFTVTNTVQEGPITYTARDTTDAITVTQTAQVSFVRTDILKTFNPSTIAAGGPSTLTVTISNLTNASVTGSGFTDTYPAGLVNAGNPTASSCGSGTVQGGAGSNALGMSGATIAANGSCTVTVSVTAATAGTYNNTATNTTGNSSAASLTVLPVSATLSTVTASPVSVAANGTTASTVTVTLKNGAANPVAGKTVTLTAASGSSTISILNAVTNASGQATFAVRDAVAESVTYSATDSTDGIAINQTASVTFTRLLAPTVAKSFDPNTIADYGTSAMTVTLTNPNNAPINGVSFTDTYPVTGDLKNAMPLDLTSTCGGGNPGTIAEGTTVTLNGGTIPANGSCSVTVKVTAAFSGTATASPIVNTLGGTASPVTSTNATASSTSGSATLTVVDVSATLSTVVADPASVPADNATISTITVTLLDGGGSAVSGKSVILSKSPGSSASMTTTSGITDTNGVATFTVKNAIAESVTFTATTDGIVIAQTATVTFGAFVSNFNAFETSYPATATVGSIFTKVAGTSFNLTVVALNGSTLSTSFSNTVKVELVANTTGAALGGNNCPSTSTTIAGMTVSSVTLTSGRGTVTFPAVSGADAYRDVRVRISYPAAAASPTVSACSADNFALRPANFVVEASNLNRTTAGTTNILNSVTFATSPLHNAGRPFRIAATANNASGVTTAGYAGAPGVSATFCSTGPACTSTAGSIAASGWTASSGTLSSDNATYNEIGAFTLVVTDSTFAVVDLNDGSTPGQRDIVGAAIIGRFVPDRFVLSPTATPFVPRSDLTGCSSSTFTYMGEPMSAGLSLTAVNAAGTTMTRYAGSWARLDLTDPLKYNLAATSSVGILPASRLVAAAITGSWIAGVANVTLPFQVTMATGSGPYTNFKLGIAPTDLDGVALSVFDMDTDVAVAGDDHRQVGATTMVRLGRMRIDNAYGSPLLSLPVRVATEYWNGSGYVVNTDDNCTSFSAGNFAALSYVGSGLTTTNLGGGTAARGIGTITLSKPTTFTGKSSVDVISGITYLPGSGRQTFGVYRSGPVIYMREMY